MEEKKPYKINIGDVVTINREDYNGHTFYKIPVQKKDNTGSKIIGNKRVTFKGKIDLQDGTLIKIKDMFEDFYMMNKFNAMFTLVILDFEIVEEPKNNQGIDYDPYSFQMNDLSFDETELV